MTVCVAVATVWTTNQSIREQDQPAVTNPVRLEEWLMCMNIEERLDLYKSNRIQSQLLFGDQVLLLKVRENWAYVIALGQPSGKDARGYPGWVPLCQLDNHVSSQTALFAVITSKKALLMLEETTETIWLSYQTKLPYLDEKDGRIGVETPLGRGYLHQDDVMVLNGHEDSVMGIGKDIVTCGEQFIGLPYLWGGMSSYGYDCSGFTYTMHKANGYIIPRDAGEQAKNGVPIPLHKKEPGDLLFFAYEQGRGVIHHVGIYYGEGKMLHAPYTGKTVELISLKDTIYEKELCAVRRYWH